MQKAWRDVQEIKGNMFNGCVLQANSCSENISLAAIIDTAFS